MLLVGCARLVLYRLYYANGTVFVKFVYYQSSRGGASVYVAETHMLARISWVMIRQKMYFFSVAVGILTVEGGRLKGERPESGKV